MQTAPGLSGLKLFHPFLPGIRRKGLVIRLINVEHPLFLEFQPAANLVEPPEFLVAESFVFCVTVIGSGSAESANGIVCFFRLFVIAEEDGGFVFIAEGIFIRFFLFSSGLFSFSHPPLFIAPPLKKVHALRTHRRPGGQGPLDLTQQSQEGRADIGENKK